MIVLKGGLFNVGNSFSNDGGCMKNPVPAKNHSAIMPQLKKNQAIATLYSSAGVFIRTSSSFMTKSDFNELACISSEITNCN